MDLPRFSERVIVSIALLSFVDDAPLTIGSSMG
jgi:hypothetical protein